jgi:hypothetical protein
MGRYGQSVPRFRPQVRAVLIATSCSALARFRR